MTRLGALAFAGALAVPAAAQVTTDGSVGARQTLTGPSIGIPDSLGLRIGSNLLHSFGAFNVRTGETATFVGLGGIENIIARITGGAASIIDGTVRSTIPGSNLFLINPSGIVFGPGASINVPGSFHASTAHYLKLADGTVIGMRAAEGVTLTFAPPSAFGFEGTAAPIVLSGAQLAVAEGRRISLAGGDIWMGASAAGRASRLSAPSGTIGVVAVQSAGEAVIEANGLATQSFGAMGSLTIRDNALIAVNEGPLRRGGGAISLSGGNVTIDHASVESRTVFAPGRGITISATDSLAINAANVLSVTRGAGPAGAMTLAGRDITISDGSLVDTSCDPGCTAAATGGALTVNAGRSLTLLGNNATNTTFLVSNSLGGGNTGPIAIRTGSLSMSGNAALQGNAVSTGSGTSITIVSDSISLTNGAQIDVATRGSGRGGSIFITNAGAIRIEGTRIVNTATGLKNSSGLFANAESSGAGGQIVIATGSLEVLGGGEIGSNAKSQGTGAAGRIAIAARGTIRVAGTDDRGKRSAIVSNTFSSGEGGDIELSADTLVLEDLALIQTQSGGTGRAGQIRIQGRAMSIRTLGQVSSEGIFAGDGGNIDVRLTEDLRIEGLPALGEVELNSGFYVQANGLARGGSIFVRARDVVISQSGGIFAGARGAGAGGSIQIDASRNVEVSTGGRIAVESRRAGPGGSLQLTAGNALTLTEGGRLNAQTFGAGNGGSIVATARTIDISGNAEITAFSRGAGNAGSLTVVAADTLDIRTGGRITTAALLADGGDIDIRVGRMATLSSGQVTTAVGTGLGSGGNITFRVPTLIMDNSFITANAFGGNGGNIRLGTTTFVPSATSRVTASSTLGIDGTITLESPALDPTGGLLPPSPNFLDAGAVLAGRCGPRLAGRASSLLVSPSAYLAEATAWAQPLACFAPPAARS